MAIHDTQLNLNDPETSIEVFERLTRKLLAQAEITNKRFDFYKLLIKTGETEGLSNQRDSVLESWYFLEKVESALQPWWDAGYPKPVYPRPNFLEEIQREDQKNSWDGWAKQAKLHTDPADTDGTDIAEYRAAKEKLLSAAARANASYGAWKAAAQVGADPAQTAELQAAALRAWHALELAEYDFRKFTEAGFPPAKYERPNFEEPVQEQPSPWSAWSAEIGLESRVNNERHPDERRGLA